jgi:hypothetical protein
MLLYPLRGMPLFWLLLMGLGSVLFHAVGAVSGLLSMLLGAVWWLMAFKLAGEALTVAASGREGDPSYEPFAGDAMAARQVFLGLALLVLGWLAWAIAERSGLLLYCVALALLLPAMVILLVMEDSLLSAFNPGGWYELLRRVGADYLVVACKLTLLAGVVALTIVYLLPSLMPWAATGVMHLLAMYALLAGYHALGELLDRHRDALELPSAETIERPNLGSPDEDRAMFECDQLVAANRAAEGAALLDRLIRGRGASAPVHARYRELLAGLGDEQGLLRHAHDYVAVLLGLGKEREALALYLASRAMYGEFELEEPQRVSELIALAARNQHSKLAVALAEEFARRFPRDRDLVLNGLTAARLMDRLDRDDDARRLLTDLLARFPEHELRPELEAAFNAIGPNTP